MTAMRPSLFAALVAFAGTARAAPTRTQIARGQYLVDFAACNDCHTPLKFNPETKSPEPDMAHMLSGHPAGAADPQGKLGDADGALIGGTFTEFTAPFGTIYSANLTPDKETGLGTWTVEMFIQAVRTGRHLGQGRAILPPMPWYGLATLTDEDLRAIFAYLQSIPAVHNAVPEPKVSEATLAELARGNAEILKQLRIPAPSRGKRGGGGSP